MSDIITTLHPENDAEINLYPNVKSENIPNNAIGRDKLDGGVNSLLNSINELHPSGTDTSTNILAFTTNKGIYIGTDNGHWYYWDGTQYVDGGLYQSTELPEGLIDVSNIFSSVNKGNIDYNKFIEYGYFNGSSVIASSAHKYIHILDLSGIETIDFNNSAYNYVVYLKDNANNWVGFANTPAFYSISVNGYKELYINVWDGLVTNLTIYTKITLPYYIKDFLNFSTKLTSGNLPRVFTGTSLSGISYTHYHIVNNSFIKRIRFKALQGSGGIVFVYRNNAWVRFGDTSGDYDISINLGEELYINFYGEAYCKYVLINDYNDYLETTKQAYILDKKLVFNKIGTGQQAIYSGIKLLENQKPSKMICKCIFSNDGISGGSACIISNPNGLTSASQIINKSLHAVFNDLNCHIEVYNNGVATRLYTETYDTPLSRNAEYTFSWEIVNDTIILNTGSGSHTITIPNDIDINEYIGRYCTLEHYMYLETGCIPQITKFAIYVNNNLEVYDDFDRNNGSIGVTRSGNLYIQFRNESNPWSI